MSKLTIRWEFVDDYIGYLFANIGEHYYNICQYRHEDGSWTDEMVLSCSLAPKDKWRNVYVGRLESCLWYAEQIEEGKVTI